MGLKFGIISYDAPHHKSSLVLEALSQNASFDLEVFCLPFVRRPSRDVRFQHRPAQTVGEDIPTIAGKLGLDVHRIPGPENLPTSIDFYVLLGAPLIPAEVAESRVILNCHSGLLPQMRGLDAFKWAILLNQPLGVTLHRIDRRVDLGYVYARRRTEISIEMTIEEAAACHYGNEISMLIEFWPHLASRPRKLRARRECPPRMRMPAQQEAEMLLQWPHYREKWAS